MNEKQKLALLIVLSLGIHIIILYLIPSINLIPKDKEQIYEVKLIKKKPKKIVKKHKITKKNNKQINKKTAKKQVKKKKIQKKKINYAGLKKPNVELPNITNKEKINVPKGKVEVENLSPDQFTKSANVDVKKELKKESSKISNQKLTKANKNFSSNKDSFLQINSLSNERRGLVNYPPKPKFALENDTKVRIKFKINRFGIPMNIRFVTRSVSKIEKISLDYVNKLRFSAVEYEKPDEVEITLYFKVRK
jgi:outer membrane biosynthesis protein TonB